MADEQDRRVRGIRGVAILTALSIVVSACGSSVAEEQPAPALTIAPSDVMRSDALPSDVADSAIPAANPAVLGAELAQPEERAEPADDPWSVTVATAKDEVTWVDVRQEPDGPPAEVEWGVWNPTPWGTPLAMLVTGGTPDEAWVQVQVPVKPNHTKAWVRTADFTFTSHRFHAEVDLTAHRVTVWNGDELVAQTDAVIGNPATPTPVGRFYVNDLLPGPNHAYGPWVLSLSAYSEAMEKFQGAEPVIAIHGTNQPELVGQSLSNGCIRVPNDIIELLADQVPLGTPVDIFA